MESLIDSFGTLFFSGLGLGFVLWFASYAVGLVVAGVWYIIKRG